MMALSRRRLPTRTADRSAVSDVVFSEQELSSIEAGHPNGMSVQEVVDAFVGRGARLTEATFRKYVQLGLVPRSTRVGRKGKHRGSQGLYPSTAVRQIDHIRRLMSQGITMEDIQREFLFVRGDIDALERQLERIYSALERAMDAHRAEGAERNERDALGEARVVGADLLGRLEGIERRLALRARMARAVV
jgi:hypothetical protein